MDSKAQNVPRVIPRKPVPERSSPPVPGPTAPPTTSPVASSRHPVRSAALLAYLAGTLLGTLVLSWRWLISGTPLLLLSLVGGAWHQRRVVPWAPLWTIFIALNFAYVVALTSWLLMWPYMTICYFATILSCLFQFEFAASLARASARKLLQDVLFVNDTVGLFDLPALEIDSDTTGLLVVRGLTFSLSTLTATVYGIEVGIKLSDEMELAIQTDKAVIKLFRSIRIGDVYANIKGSEEMCFTDIKPWPNPRDMTQDHFIVSGTPILKSAMASSRRDASSVVGGSSEEAPFARTNTQRTTRMSPDDKAVRADCDAVIRHISETSTNYLARCDLQRLAKDRETSDQLDNALTLRAAISAHIHIQPTIAHPPQKSIRLTTLTHNTHPKVKRFLHRLPFLYRLLLNLVSYFHPIFVTSITSTGSGEWFNALMKKYFFKHYSSSGAEVRRLQTRIGAWLADANFAVGLSDVYCTGHVPMNTEFDIECKLKIADLKAHRILPEAAELSQVIHLGGADCAFTLPSYLLPHHEHLLPSKITDFEEMNLQQEIEEEKGTPKAVQLQQELGRRQRDEGAMKISAHGHLPAIFDQQLLNFAAALVKAMKVIESEKDHEAVLLKRAETASTRDDPLASETIVVETVAGDEESTSSEKSDESNRSAVDSERSVPNSTVSAPSSWRNSISRAGRMNQTFKDMNLKMMDGWRKAGTNSINVVANERWIAKMIGNIMRKLERAQGDVGYSGLIPLPLAEYRANAEIDAKILP
ncbi:hypothetical protein F4808DRAFT_336730 [Astrocystis sublimbata]|nr:hypothetical protein F4808DRAFT_101807 [Astrocystis sublimbata]KAI0194649.1 hypothetical protein F4808DRAFT_336730 [Astrocystis sublimbata]